MLMSYDDEFEQDQRDPIMTLDVCPSCGALLSLSEPEPTEGCNDQMGCASFLEDESLEDEDDEYRELNFD